MGKRSVRLPAVSNGKNDRVPLVALDSLQVLDEESFLSAFGEELFQLRILRHFSQQPGFDRIRMLRSEGDHPKGLLRSLLGMLDDELDHAMHLRIWTDPRLILGWQHIHENMVNHITAHHARERRQIPTVDLLIRESDQSLIAASVVP